MLTGEHFVAEGLISSEQLELATCKQRELGGGDPIARVLVTMGLIAERDRVRCLGKVWGVQFIDVADCVPRPEAISLISPQVAKRFRCLPLEQQGGKLIVAMGNPLDIFVIDELRITTD